MQNVVNIRTCRKCKKQSIIESRKYCDDCKLKQKICECGKIFRSQKHQYCKLCRNSKGNDGVCEICNNNRHIYYNSGTCTTCYKFITKYKITKQQLLNLRLITNCELCGINIEHSIKNNIGQAVLDHDHKTGKLRGVLCVNCNIIEGMLRDPKHLKSFYDNYENYMQKSL